ncbi:hypothetical protein LWI29_018351 [Acer saccharum]|uniref:Uncharacterized protein n=1 Tax=Acer saccharum TaxID=4024 RepID=A0AA39VZE0_ACESA|nr:hypothetical protein LWI29_018351 [Acer saccharum]
MFPFASGWSSWMAESDCSIRLSQFSIGRLYTFEFAGTSSSPFSISGKPFQLRQQKGILHIHCWMRDSSLWI